MLKGATEGLHFWPEYFSREQQRALVDLLRAGLQVAPLFTPVMPGTGKPFSVRISNFGPLGWVSDREGYRYQPMHPATGVPWPPIPELLLSLWQAVSGVNYPPDSCLLNWYGEGAHMGLHQDKDEEFPGAPIVSVSLGDRALFRVGGVTRSAPSRTMVLRSGDVVVMDGPVRHAFHGIDRIWLQSDSLLPKGGRINLTLRRAKQPQG